MRSAVSEFVMLQPRDLADALRLMQPPRGKPAPHPFAGGTDVMAALNAGTLKARCFLNLWELDELRGIRDARDTIEIGALTTYTDLRSSALVARELPALAAAAREIGAIQIQNRGTIGGNLVNASPAGDTLPVLAALDAEAILISRDGERVVRGADFGTGYRATVRRPDEIVRSIRFSRLVLRGRRQWFRKIGTRRAQAISKVMAAGRIRYAKSGVIDDIALAFGSVGPRVIRLPGVEAVLRGARPTPAVLARAEASLQKEISPIDDIRSTAEYRRRTAAVLLRRFLEETRR